jgi:hypothetical protein
VIIVNRLTMLWCIMNRDWSMRSKKLEITWYVTPCDVSWIKTSWSMRSKKLERTLVVLDQFHVLERWPCFCIKEIRDGVDLAMIETCEWLLNVFKKVSIIAGSAPACRMQKHGYLPRTWNWSIINELLVFFYERRYVWRVVLFQTPVKNEASEKRKNCFAFQGTKKLMN